MPLKTDTDRRYLARAIELADQGRGRVSPNPLVGAVIATDEETLGEGFHRAFGGPHAEVEAIRATRDHEKLADATLYAGDGARATAFAKERAELAAALASAEEEWLALSGEYESAAAE